jgi:hypothetical protein
LVLRLKKETVPDFVLLFLSPCGPHLFLFVHQVHRTEPTCLSTPRRSHRLRPFTPALHLHQRKSRRNLHMQYSAKSQSTPCCQSLITPRSDHPPASDAPVLNLPLDECNDNTHSHQFIRERKRKETNKDLKHVIKSQTKVKTRSLERLSLGPLRQVQRLNTTERKCSKLLTPQGEAKGLDTIGKRAKHKANSGDTKSSQSMNASSP